MHYAILLSFFEGLSFNMYNYTIINHLYSLCIYDIYSLVTIHNVAYDIDIWRKEKHT